jgi:hypothetical protein
MAATLEAVPRTKTVDNQTETPEADAARDLVRMAKERGLSRRGIEATRGMSYDGFFRPYGEHAAVSGAASPVSYIVGRSIKVDLSRYAMHLSDPSRGGMSKGMCCRGPAGQPKHAL